MLARDMAHGPCCACWQSNIVEKLVLIFTLFEKKTKKILTMEWEKKIIISLSFKHIYNLICVPKYFAV